MKTLFREIVVFALFIVGALGLIELAGRMYPP